jgi:hypothetical protein
MMQLGVTKKLEKSVKLEKKQKKNQTMKKKLIRILKKPTGSVRFWFYKPKTKKLNPNRKKIGKKPSQIEKNRAKPIFVLK